LDEATTYTFYGWAKNPAGISENSADASATTVQNIPDSPDISLNDVSFTSMTVHMETVYAADECYGFRRFLDSTHGAMDSSDASNVYITGLDEATTYTFLAGRNSAGISENGCQCNHRTEYPDSPDISLNDVSLPMTVHGDSLPADKNVTVSTFPEPVTVPWTSDTSDAYITGFGRSYRIYFLWLDKQFRR
jgi:hypothetical protein